jgi:hypothetical protein
MENTSYNKKEEKKQILFINKLTCIFIRDLKNPECIKYNFD